MEGRQRRPTSLTLSRCPRSIRVLCPCGPEAPDSHGDRHVVKNACPAILMRVNESTIFVSFFFDMKR